MNYRETVLVTGGAGFIGSVLVRQLVEMGKKVIVVDNLVNGRKENLVGLPSDQVILKIADIRNIPLMTKLMTEVGLVFHLACLGVRHSIHSPYENHDVNANATLKLLSTARDSGVKRFVYVSSSEVYGTARWVPMTEEHPTFPMTVYGASKLAGECYTRAFYQTYHYPTIVVRPFNAYGPGCHHEGDSGEVIPKFLLRCLAGKPLIVFGDGQQTRDFTFVEDTAKGILLAGFSDHTIGDTINLGSGNEVSINQLAMEIAATVGNHGVEIVHDFPRPGDVLRLYANSEKARSLLGFQPQLTLSEGLIKLRDWYLSQKQPVEVLLQQEQTKNWEVDHVTHFTQEEVRN